MPPVAQQVVQPQRHGGDAAHQPAAVRGPFAGARAAARRGTRSHDGTVGVRDQQLRLAEHEGGGVLRVGLDALGGVPDGAADDLLADRAPLGVVAVQ
ncbi:hypothetical protein [Streptomyces sp. NPDC101206]|uniref:hypothetical protein n=1 Tax=Streptomyces sp. NPDC101206 TaxID=3366128 RepID=UPI0038151DA5